MASPGFTAVRSAATIAGAYIVGGFVPLAPYMIYTADPQRALLVSVIVTLLALAVFGWMKGRFTGVSPFKSGLQTVTIGGLAAGAAFAIAKMIERS